MNRNISRRTLLAVAGVGVMSVGSLRMVAARAQDETQSLIFPNGNELIWVDPWSEAEDPAVEQVLPSYVGLSGGSQGEFIVGYYDAPTTIGEAVEAFLASLLEDPSIAVNIAGGGEQSVIEGTEVRKDYLLHRAVAGDVEWGLYFQLVDGVELTVFTGPVSAFASEMESAHASITLNGEGVLAGVDGAEFQRQLESPVMREPGGEYTNAAGTVRVRWNAGWTVVEQDEFGIVLTNPAQSIKVYMQRVLFEGQTWEAAAEWVFASYRDDQGANPTTYGPVVTDSRFWYATDGEYGLRLGEGTPSDDPESFVLVFAADFDDDEVDTTALLQEANAAIRLNDNPPFTALDEFIEVSAG